MIPRDVIIAAWIIVAAYSVYMTVTYSILALCWVMDKIENLIKKMVP
jgi:hypothetical protein